MRLTVPLLLPQYLCIPEPLNNSDFPAGTHYEYIVPPLSTAFEIRQSKATQAKDKNNRMTWARIHSPLTGVKASFSVGLKWGMHQKKVISKTSLTNMSNSEKSAFFRHVFANNFFLVNFFKTFSTDPKSAWNSAFFDTFSEFFKKYFFLGHISTFFELWLQVRRKRLKKTENLFYECILEFNYATIKGFA
jgi:hypothetical protein